MEIVCVQAMWIQNKTSIAIWQSKLGNKSQKPSAEIALGSVYLKFWSVAVGYVLIQVLKADEKLYHTHPVLNFSHN